MTTKKLQISIIRIDGGTQMRETISSATVEEYAERIKAGDEFPHPVVFVDEEDAHWLGGGFHRIAAYRKAGETAVTCDVRKGTVRDARLFAAGDNAAHGLPRTNADKRLQVAALLSDPEWGKWSDREIAKRCCVGHQLVATVRSSMDDSSVDKEDVRDKPTRTFKTKHGTVAERKVPAKSGPSKAKTPPPTRPKDGRGRRVDDRDVIDALAAGEKFDAVKRHLQEGLRMFAALNKGAGTKFLRDQEAESCIRQAIDYLTLDRPFVQCPMMPNCAAGNCKWCKGAKYLPKSVFERMPEELRK